MVTIVSVGVFGLALVGMWMWAAHQRQSGHAKKRDR